MSEYHALVSPSGSYKWLACPGSLAMEAGIANTSTKFADWGTANHELSAACLDKGLDAKSFEGQHIKVADTHFEIDDEHIECAQTYIDQVRGYVEEYKTRGAVEVHLFVEVQVPIGQITGEEGARGTSDFIIIAVWEDGTATLHVGDLKTGIGIEVSAHDNPQLKMYALGAHHLYELLYEFKDVRLSIHQPRIRQEPSGWECSIEHLLKFGEHAAERAFHALAVMGEQPGAVVHHLKAGDHCRKAFCRARGNCPKLDQYVADAVGADFDVLETYKPDMKAHIETVPLVIEDTERRVPTLSEKMAVLPIVEDWIKAVRARVEHELLQGVAVPGYKLVQGRMGARRWADEQEAEAELKRMRIKHDEMYKYEVISPTVAEKLFKESPKRWNKLQPLIMRSKGSISVAPESDKRPAVEVKPASDDFDAEPEDLS